MKILLVSDLHYALKQYDWATLAAPGFDMLVIAGDQIDVSGQLDGGIQVVVILKYLRKLMAQVRLVVSSGNHDLDRRDDDGEKVAGWIGQVRELGIPTDGDSIDLEGTLVTICPWWDGPRMKAAVEAQIARDAGRRKQRWIWVYHAPPEGSATSWDGHRSWGDSDLSGWIDTYRPDLVLSGHIHQAPFKREGSWVDRIGPTWVFNCGQQLGPTPCHVMIDTEVGEAVWVSLAGTEIVDLDVPLQRPVPELQTIPAWLPR